jgi:parallel beta-helix repeat protein
LHQLTCKYGNAAFFPIAEFITVNGIIAVPGSTHLCRAVMPVHPATAENHSLNRLQCTNHHQENVMGSVSRPADASNRASNVQGPENSGPKVPVTKTVEVRNAEELKAALANAVPGTKIHLADGVYEGNFTLEGKSGVTIEGSKNAIIQGGTDGYALHLNHSDNITLTGFTVSGGQKGIMLDESNNNLLDNLTVRDTGQEGIHFRNNSSHNVLQNSIIDNTGLQDPGFGEGVYIGSDPKNVANDQSNFNQVINNRFGPNVRAENVDIKEGTNGGVIANNQFNTAGISRQHYADSAVDVKPGVTGYRISGNSWATPSADATAFITFENGGPGANFAQDNLV